MDVNETRRRKARQLAQQLAGGRGKGHPEMTKKMGWDGSLTSQLLGSNPTRKITDKRARQIEAAFGKPHGWLDQPEEAEEPKPSFDKKLFLQCMREIRAEMRRLDLNLTPEDEDKIFIEATFYLYEFSKEAGELLSARAALTAALS